MAEPKFKIGDEVVCPNYDKFERPINRVGRARVEAIFKIKVSESGIIIRSRSEKGWLIELDQAWWQRA